MHSARKRLPEGPPRIPDHETVRLIGRGSYGEVWLARNAVGTWRAVKVVYRDRFKDSIPYEREFVGIQKYEPISRSHEGLVDVLQIGRNEAEGYFYCVMELADDANPGPGVAARPSGVPPEVQPLQPSLHVESAWKAFQQCDPATYTPRTLSLDLIRHGRLSLNECVALGLTLNLALGHLHRNGLIHRDVKPPNIIFVNGVPKLADIGLVADLSGANSFVGTEGYVAPEGPNSRQADLYALGKVLYEASTGKDRQEFPSPLTDFGNDTDAKALMELHAVVVRACAASPKQRYRTAEEMNADLALLHSGKSVLHKHAVERRLKITTRVAVAAVAAVVLGVFPYYLAIKEAREEAAQRKRAQASEKRAEQAQAGEARARATAEQRLYDSLLGEARATRMARRVGYRDKVFSLLKQANALKVPQKNLAELRREAGDCLGDFVGLTPQTIDGFPTNTTIRLTLLDPSGRSAAFVLRDETVQLRELPSGKVIANFRLTGDLPTRSACFNHTGDEIVFIRIPPDGRLEDRIAGSRLNVWSRNADGQWREAENVAIPGGLDCLSHPGGVYVTAFHQTPRRGQLINVRPKARPLLAEARVPANSGSKGWVHQFEYPEERIPEVALSPDGQWLVSEGVSLQDKVNSVLNIVNLKTGARSTLVPQLGVLDSLGFSPDGKHLACTSRSSGAIYEIARTPITEFRRVADFTSQTRQPMVFAPTSGLVGLPIPRENRIRLWDWIRGEETALLDEPKPATKLAFDPGGAFLLTASLQLARLYRMDMTSEKLNLPRHECNNPGVVFSPDGERVATVGREPAVRVCDAASGREIWNSDQLPVQAYGVAFSPDGKWLATGDSDASRVLIWNSHTGERLAEVLLKADGRLWSVQFSPCGKFLATASGLDRAEDGVELWAIHRLKSGERETLNISPLNSAGGSAWSLSFAPNGRWLAFVDRDLRGVFLWELEGLNAPRLLAAELIRGVGEAQTFSFTPDCSRVLTVDRSRSVVALDTTTGKRVTSFATIDPIRTPVWTDSAGICLSPDGSKLAMVSATGRGVDVWDPITGKLVYALPEEHDTVYWQAWSPDGQHLAVARSNGDIAIWNLKQVEQILASLELNP